MTNNQTVFGFSTLAFYGLFITGAIITNSAWWIVAGVAAWFFASVVLLAVAGVLLKKADKLIKLQKR